MPPPSLDKTCTQSLDLCACGVEPSLYQDRFFLGDPTRNNIQRFATRSVQRCGGAQTHPGVLPHRQLFDELSVRTPSLNKTCTQSLRTVSCGVELSPHRDVNAGVQTISQRLKEFSNANGHRRIAVLPLPTRKDANSSVSRQSFTPVDIVSVATALRTPNSATSRHASVPSAHLKR